MVALRANETSHPAQTWLAWALVLLSICAEIYSAWWNVFLRSMNEVLSSSRIMSLAYAVKLALSFFFLLLGGGLLSVPVAGLIASLLLRAISRRRVLAILPVVADERTAETSKKLLRILWPNSWRLGLQLSSAYLTTNANAMICLSVFGLVANAQYGLSVQAMMIAQSVAMVWTAVKFPLIGQLRARQEMTSLQRMLWPRVWLQLATFILLAAAVVTLGPFLLQWIGTEKKILPTGWLLLLALNTFLEMQFVFWGTLISTENRLPYLWPAVASNVLSLALTLLLIHFTALGLGSLGLAPLLAGSLFNYWYWLPAGAGSIQTRWFKFMFSRPLSTPVQSAACSNTGCGSVVHEENPFRRSR